MTLPGTLSKDFLGNWPPWVNKRIVAPQGFLETDIIWFPIDQIIPVQPRSELTNKLEPPDPYTYPALIIGHFSLSDGHHRYYELIDGGYHGTVPVIRQIP